MVTSMKLLILYYSGTGNTEFACTVAKAVAERGGHEVTMKTFAQAGGISLGDYDAYCFATPLQAWQPTKNVERFIKAMPPLEGKAAFLLSSSGGQPSQTAPLMTRWLRRKGIAVTGHFDLLCPDSWPVSRRSTHKLDQERPDVESLRELADFTRGMLEMLAAFLAGKKVALPRYHVRPTLFFILSRLERLAKGRPNLTMGKKKIIESDCTQCGICGRDCPAGAIRLDPYPVFGKECSACWRCINCCPEDCITTRLSSPYHYKGIPDKGALLEKAGLGNII
jgi:ferredoxin/flavodoxin